VLKAPWIKILHQGVREENCKKRGRVLLCHECRTMLSKGRLRANVIVHELGLGKKKKIFFGGGGEEGFESYCLIK
jgi:hypothetical protein